MLLQTDAIINIITVIHKNNKMILIVIFVSTEFELSNVCLIYCTVLIQGLAYYKIVQ